MSARHITEEGPEDTSARKQALDRVWGSMPWLRPIEKRYFRVKVFKSGNSLALRLPAELNLKAGMEMDMQVENGDSFSFHPVEPTKRKFNIGKVAGSATNLRPIEAEDRAFRERPPIWPGTADDTE